MNTAGIIKNTPKTNWVTVKQFMKYYSLSTTMAYTLIHAEGFPAKKVGEKAYRVDLSRTDDYFDKQFN